MNAPGTDAYRRIPARNRPQRTAMKTVIFGLSLLTLVATATSSLAQERVLTIVHSNDLHSHLLGAAPNLDYTPATVNDDDTLGGWARIATIIQQVRAQRTHPVLVLDAGDFLMGSLFHLASREAAHELQLLKIMGYDAVALGNHEFDLKPDGLARILNAADRHGRLPALVCSNLIFDPDDSDDDSLAQAFERGLIRPYRVLERNGLRIGLFALVGRDAAEVAPFASPVTFGDPVATARRMVGVLRDQEQVDVVVCLSHSGLSSDPQRSEDENLARQVNGLDIIVSGHTHTRTTGPRTVNGTLIVQAWEYGKQIGVLDVTVASGGTTLKDYALIDVDDRIAGNPDISARIVAAQEQIDREVLAPADLAFDRVLAQTTFDLDITTAESNLGNLIADAIGWYVNRYAADPADPVSRVAVAIISNGVIRDPILRGKTGNVTVGDAFRAIPLGIGFDPQQSLGYPLIAFYIYPAELKKGFEILTSIYPLKGSDYFLQFSGARITYNPHRLLFDRVTKIELGNETDGYTPLDCSRSNQTLLRVAADIYNATFLKIVGNFTWHILDIVPKDRQGNPITDLKTVRVDMDPATSGIQELKEWRGVLEYIRSFPDTTGDGLADIPPRYRGPLGRNTIAASWNPYHLVKGGPSLTWLALAIVMTLLTLVGLVVWLLIRWLVHRRRPA